MDSIPATVNGRPFLIDGFQVRDPDWGHLPLLLRSRLAMETTEAGIKECVNSEFWKAIRSVADVATKKQCQRVVDDALARIKAK